MNSLQQTFKLILTYALLSLFSSAAFASDLPRIVFLTSFKEENSLVDIRSFYEKSLKENFDVNKYQIIIKNNADKFDLWQALHSSKNIAIFWVGHANAPIENAGMDIGGDVIDETGANISNYFKDINPNILWVGLIGCNTSKTIEQYKTEGFYNNNPNLIIDSFDFKVEVKHGVSTSLQKASEYVSRNFSLFEDLHTDEVQDGIKIQLTRTIPSDANEAELTSVSVEHEGRTIAVFPKGSPGEIQVLTTQLIVNNEDNASEYTIAVNTGRSSENTRSNIPAIGLFNITSEKDGLTWSPLKLSSGKIMGVNKNVYRLAKQISK